MASSRRRAPSGDVLLPRRRLVARSPPNVEPAAPRHARFVTCKARTNRSRARRTPSSHRCCGENPRLRTSAPQRCGAQNGGGASPARDQGSTGERAGHFDGVRSRPEPEHSTRRSRASAHRRYIRSAGPDAANTLLAPRKQGVHVKVLTGDGEHVATHVCSPNCSRRPGSRRSPENARASAASCSRLELQSGLLSLSRS